MQCWIWILELVVLGSELLKMSGCMWGGRRWPYLVWMRVVFDCREGWITRAEQAHEETGHIGSAAHLGQGLRPRVCGERDLAAEPPCLNCAWRSLSTRACAPLPPSHPPRRLHRSHYTSWPQANLILEMYWVYLGRGGGKFHDEKSLFNCLKLFFWKNNRVLCVITCRVEYIVCVVEAVTRQMQLGLTGRGGRG